MDRPDGQPQPDARPHGTGTRQKLIDAAIDVMATNGAAGTTTRAVADRAQLPHGAVSYHFHGKQHLLREAVTTALTELFAPLLTEPATISHGADDPDWLARWVTDLRHPRSARIFVESIGLAQHDPELRDRFASMLRSARAGLVSATGSTPGMATLFAAAMDGLVLHAALDPEIDVMGALSALQTALPGGTHHGR